MISDNAKLCVFLTLKFSVTWIHALIQQMDLLEQTLEKTRSASLPKTKFTFKRKTNKPPLSAAPTLPPSSSGANELGRRDGLPGTSDFNNLSSHSHCRLSLQSIPTSGEGSPLSDLIISDLDHCIVDLRATAGSVRSQNQLNLTALHIRDLKETLLILPNVKGSVILHNLYRCTAVVTCHQVGTRLSLVRMRTAFTHSSSSACTTRWMFAYTSPWPPIRLLKTALLSRLQSIHCSRLYMIHPSMGNNRPT
jgi:hypothetical protein